MDYYEVLGVPKDADEVQIRKSYLRLSLKWHPDKHLDEAEEYTEKFQVLQKAYSVLSDSSKRTLYDYAEKKTTIIDNKKTEKERRDKEEGKKWYQWSRWFQSTQKDNPDNPDNQNLKKSKRSRTFDPNKSFRNIRFTNLNEYVNRTWFKDFSDEIYGFYTRCRQLFEKLSLEADGDPDVIATFGSSNSDYETVVKPFYTYWSNFVANPKVWPCPRKARRRKWQVRFLVRYIQCVDKRSDRTENVKYDNESDNEY